MNRNGKIGSLAGRRALAVDKIDFAAQRDDLLQGIERDQEGMRVAVHELTGAASSKLDLSAQIKKFPLTWTIGAFLVGVWLGGRGAPARVARQRSSS
jgi:hypothetical protein